jgi:hypothetical protein
MLLAFALILAAPSFAQVPQYESDGTSRRTVRIKGLSSGECIKATMNGRVAKREFDKKGVVITGVVIENASGARAFINVDSSWLNSPQLSTVARDSISTGLQTLLREGRQVDLVIRRCGAAGRVLTLDEVS